MTSKSDSGITDEEMMAIFQKATKKAVQGLWDKGLPAHGMDEDGNIIEFYSDGTQKIVTKKEDLGP